LKVNIDFQQDCRRNPRRQASSALLITFPIIRVRRSSPLFRKDWGYGFNLGKTRATLVSLLKSRKIHRTMDTRNQCTKRIVAGLSVVVFTASAQTTAEHPHFEVARVQRSATATNPFTVISGGVLRGERYESSKASVLDMIRIAWDVDPDIVSGGPDWLEFDRFDIAAKAPAGTPPSTVRLML
jgi:hypothetical protein